MDNRPIGIFDSGLGGLTCIKPLHALLPNESIIYFGDTARTPYGSKAVSTIKHFTMQIGEFLVKHNVKMIVIACNTVSATCIDDLKKQFPEITIVGIIEPAASWVAENCDDSDIIGVIGTKVTIASHAYKDRILKKNSNLEVWEKATPAFVPLVEEDIIASDIMDLTIEYYMDDFILENRINTIILGCTHYPLLLSNIKRKYPNLNIVNPSIEVANTVKKILKEKAMLAEKYGGDSLYYASDLSENFQNMIDKIFGDREVKTKFKNLDVI